VASQALQAFQEEQEVHPLVVQVASQALAAFQEELPLEAFQAEQVGLPSVA
jgi:hypothetical protein